MENTLLIGLSRQTTLERQLDVVANNIANVNTAGFKADSSLFEEYLTSGAHEDNFVGSDRRVSYVQDRGTFRDFTQGATEQTKNPLDLAIDGSAFLVVQTPAGQSFSAKSRTRTPGTAAAAARRSRLMQSTSARQGAESYVPRGYGTVTAQTWGSAARRSPSRVVTVRVKVLSQRG